MNKFTKQEKSWIMYDWANSVYATIIMAAVYPIYFTTVCSSLNIPGDVWWGTATSIATLIVAISAPFLGSIGDYKGMKKKLLFGYLCLGVTFTLVMAIFDNPTLMLVGYILSYVGFGGGNLVYDSLLTDVTTPEKMDKVSSYGFAAGYIGGSTIPFIVSILLIQFGSNFGLTGSMPVKVSVVMTSLWWLLFSLPLLFNVKQVHYIETATRIKVNDIMNNLVSTLKKIASDKKLLFFILAYFFYIDGVGTVIHLATAYGSTLGLDSVGMILALLVTQIVAVPCSILFGTIASKKGSIQTIIVGILIYVVVCFVGFYMGYLVEAATPENLAAATDKALVLFWLMAALVGTVQGGIQALSRSYFGKLIPPEHSNEYFGFFDIFGKFATILGPMIYAVVATMTGASYLGILGITVLFIIGLVLIFAGKKYWANTPNTK